MIDEHAPRNADNKAGAYHYEPTPEEKKAVKLVERLLSKAKRHRAQYDGKWVDYYHMFRGKQWKENRPSYRHSEVINHIFKSIQSTVPIQVDARPRFEFLPQEPSDMPISDLLNEAAESDWTRNGWSEQLLEVVYDANFYGTGLSSMLFDPKADYGKGAICYESIDPLYCYPDPDARDVNKKCCYFTYAEPMDVEKIKRMYPDKKEFIKPDMVDLTRESKTDLFPNRFRSPVDQRIVMETSSSTSDGPDKHKALLVICYINADYLTDEFDENEKIDTDPATGEPIKSYEQVAKYPNGRKIVICNNVLLEDGPNPYDDGQIPYQRYVNYLLPREFWGISEVEQLEGPQKTFNKMVSFALDVMTLMGNPIWKVPTSTGIDTDNLTTRPGLVLEYDGDTPPTREEGVSLQPYVLQMIDRMAEWFDSVSGSQDVSRGVQPTGVTAASAISSLQEAAQTRIRQKSRNLDTYLQFLGQQWVSRTFQHRTAPEIYRLTGKDEAQKYFRMHVEDYEKTQTQMVADPATGQMVETQVPTGEIGKRMVVQPYLPNGQMNPQELQHYEIQGKFDVKVTTGSSLPFARAEKEQKLLNYFDRGIIDQEEVLKGSDYPNYQAVMQRMQEKAAADAQAQAAAQAPPPAPPGGQAPAA